MSRPTHCPNTDHDGAKVPVTRYINASKDTVLQELALCEYCAEGKVAVLVSAGWRVTIAATWSAPVPNAHGRSLRDELLDLRGEPTQVPHDLAQHRAVRVDDLQERRVDHRIALKVADVLELGLHLIGQALDIQADLGAGHLASKASTVSGDATAARGDA